MIKRTSPKLLGLVIISLAFLNGCGPSMLLDTPGVPIATGTSLPTAGTIPTAAFTVTPFTPPSEQPIISPTETFLPLIGFDFETDTKGWHTSEVDNKLAETSVTTTTAHTGVQSLQITTELFGDQSPEFAAKKNDQVYLHTEATGYFDSSIPDGLNKPGPYDLKGNRVSCFVFLPAGLVKKDTPPVYIQIFVKDSKFANQFSDAVDITESNVEKWIELSLVVDNTNGADAQFDPKHVNTLGIRLEVSHGSTLSYTGPIYIDTCTIEYP